MFKSLKIKIFLSFLLLVLMLVIAGVMSIMEFQKLGNSVNKVLKNNYQSVESAKVMLDAIEREDSGILMWMLGETEEGEKNIQRSDSMMKSAIINAKQNITEKNEDLYVEEIIKGYNLYNEGIVEIINSNGNLDENKQKYANTTSRHFAATKKAIYNLMDVNQELIYKQSNKMIEDSQRAMMPAIISIIGAIIFAILLNFFISIFFIRPLRRLINAIKAYYPEQGTLNCGIQSNDEIKTLENEINSLILRLTRFNK